MNTNSIIENQEIVTNKYAQFTAELIKQSFGISLFTLLLV